LKITWSPLAVDQVRDIASYMALDKPTITIEWAEKIFNSVEILSGNPESRRMVSEINKKKSESLFLVTTD